MKLSKPASTLLLLALLAAPLAAQEGAWASIGPDGGGVSALAAAPSRPDRLYAALQNGGFYKSVDRGQTWTLAGWPNTQLTDLAVDPRAPYVIYGIGSLSVLRSVDGGATWQILRRDYPDDRHNGVEVNPHNGVVFTFSERYLFRSANRGATWEGQENGLQDVQALAFDPVRPHVVYAAGPQGLFRSTDGGKTWQPWGQGIPAGTALRTLAVDPRNPRTLWAGADNLSVGVFKSTDGGATWKPSQRGLRRREVRLIAVDPVRPSILHVLLRHGELFRSRDGGASWVASPGPGEPVTDLDALPYGLLAGTSTGISLSPDRGLTWHTAQRGLHSLAIDGLAIDSQDPPRLYAGTTHAGVFKTRDRGASWLRLAPLDDPLDRHRPVAVSPQDPETVYVGTGVSVARSSNGGRRWESRGALSCGVPEAIVVDPRDPGTLYTSGFIFFYSGCAQLPTTCLVARSLDAGASWSCIQNGLPSLFSKVLGVDPSTSAVYIQSQESLWRSTDQGDTWSLVLEGINPLSFAASPLAEGTLYVGVQAQVARSVDGGQTWTFVAVGVTDAVVGLAVSPEDPRVVYAAVLQQGVFRSTDGGATWSPLGTWPQWSIHSGPVVDPADPSIVYVGTGEVGVLRFDVDGE